MELSVPTTIRHPYRHTPVRTDDIDALCDAYMAARDEIRKMQSFTTAIRMAMQKLTTSDTKTRRLFGSRFEVVLTMPNDHWEQRTLKDLWTHQPGLAQRFLRIERLAPQLVEVKKLENGNGDPSLESFKAKLLGARVPANTPATISIKEK